MSLCPLALAVWAGAVIRGKGGKPHRHLLSLSPTLAHALIAFSSLARSQHNYRSNRSTITGTHCGEGLH